MPDLSALLSALKSPKTALAVFLFSAALLFAPFDRLGLTRPTFTTEYESLFIVILFLSAAVLAVEILSWVLRLATRPYYAWKRKQRIEEIFLSLKSPRVVRSLGNDATRNEDDQGVVKQPLDAFFAPEGLPTPNVRHSVR